MERFWSKVNKDGPIFRAELGPCWVWTAALVHGYGAFSGVLGTARAHRASWILANGEIAVGLSVLHHCDNRSCVRPSHLFLGTIADNNADMIAKGRHARGTSKRNAKLNDDAVRAIRVAISSGAAQRELARRYGVCQKVIRLVASGVSWSHVTPIGGQKP